MATIPARLICAQRPPETRGGGPTEFGLQDKKRALLAGDTLADGSSSFVFTLTAEIAGDGIQPGGPWVHGTPGDRFLYLGWRPVGAEDGWIRRWKISLGGITPELIAGTDPDQGLELRIGEPGRTVWLDGEWTKFDTGRVEASSAAV